MEIAQKYIVAKNEYSREPIDTRIDLNAVNLTDTYIYNGIGNAYLVEETPPVELGFNLVEFTRRWVTNPKDRTEYSSFSYVFPGREDDTDFFSYFISPANQSFEFRTANGNVVRISGSFDQIDEGTRIKVYVSNSNIDYYYRTTVLAKTASYIDIPLSVNSTISKIVGEAPLIAPRSSTVGARVFLQYFNTLDPSTIPIQGVFTVVDGASGTVTEILTNTSTPTIAEYEALENICVSPTVIKPYRGWHNLWEASTTYVTPE
ncbi:hypothetical protein [Puniceicoccus vermicola]|uniref:Uncharacterized protein n=1 Tax=Puniceicoccus vermicola TaxID=388746 RepID=A0A7X1AY22_9BACT|nr:hypothetical protein [Puniceicoccus vermicola]MBC2602086.1 hypothetical protein [Puniceicoccus vermicola]